MTKSFRVNRPRVQVDFSSDSGLTKQSFRDECNVNNIMSKYQLTGLLTHVSQFSGQYGDFTEVQDYQESLNQVMLAQDMFMSLPSVLRARFANDPAQFLDFVGNPSNLDEMRSLGLLKPEVSAPNVAPLTASIEDSTPV